jgi:ssDNA-binding Zn-finger/Zn-ribbon topoisomerase 1
MEDQVNCLGYTGVSKKKDLDNPKLEEKILKLKQENNIKPEWLQSTQCTECRQGYMELKKGKYGEFLACSRYPACKHTIKIKRN